MKIPPLDRLPEKRISMIIHRTQDQLYSVLFTLCRDPALCEDIMQETYIRIWKNLDNIKDDETILTLVKTYARNIFIDELRRSSRKEAALVQMNPDAWSPSPEDLLARMERSKEVQEAISKLPKQQQLIFRLHKEHALSYRQIAAQLGIATGTIEKQMGRALKFLRAELRHLDQSNGAITILLVFYLLS